MPEAQNAIVFKNKTEKKAALAFSVGFCKNFSTGLFCKAFFVVLLNLNSHR
jgi:hypothetical protein